MEENDEENLLKEINKWSVRQVDKRRLALTVKETVVFEAPPAKQCVERVHGLLSLN